MKKVILFWGLLCSICFYSCQKFFDWNQHGNPHYDSNITDPAGLVSPSQHGKLDTIKKGFSFTEGPAVDKHGNVFFTDQPNDKIYRWDAFTGAITTFLTGTGRANGMAFDKDGNLIACADMHGELWKIFPDGSHEVLVDNYGGKLLNGPNDVWINRVNPYIIRTIQKFATIIIYKYFVTAIRKYFPKLTMHIGAGNKIAIFIKSHSVCTTCTR